MGVNMNYNGIEINEFPLLFYTIFHTILLLTLIAVGVVGFFVFYDKDGKKRRKEWRHWKLKLKIVQKRKSVLKKADENSKSTAKKRFWQ